MKSDRSNQYVSSLREETETVGPLIVPKVFWDAVAHDYGAHNASRQKKGTYELSGFNDLAYFDDDLHALSVLEKVKTPEVAPARGANGLPPQLRIEGRLRRIVPVFLARFVRGVRLAEQFQAVYEAARDHGYLSQGYAVTSKVDVWTDPTAESLAEVVEFLADLQGRLRSDEFNGKVGSRIASVARDLSAQESLLEAVIFRYGDFHVAVYDIGFHVSAVALAAFPSSAQQGATSLLGYGRQLIDSMLSAPSLSGQCLGAILHLEFHKDRGSYLRSVFLVAPGNLGFRQQFEARLVRAWQAISGRRGWVEDRRGGPNKLVGGVGMVSASDSGSIARIRKAITYGAQKDIAMRVDTSDQSTFIVADFQASVLHGAGAFLPAHQL